MGQNSLGLSLGLSLSQCSLGLPKNVAYISYYIKCLIISALYYSLGRQLAGFRTKLMCGIVICVYVCMCVVVRRTNSCFWFCNILPVTSCHILVGVSVSFF